MKCKVSSRQVILGQMTVKKNMSSEIRLYYRQLKAGVLLTST